jgi:hypothetical protein
MNSSTSAYQSLLDKTSAIESSILNPQSSGTLSNWASAGLNLGLYRTSSRTVHCPLLLSVAAKRVTVSKVKVEVKVTLRPTVSRPFILE